MFYKHVFVNFYLAMKTPYTFKGVPFCHAFKICIQNKIKQLYLNKNTINNVWTPKYIKRWGGGVLRGIGYNIT